MLLGCGVGSPGGFFGMLGLRGSSTDGGSTGVCSLSRRRPQKMLLGCQVRSRVRSGMLGLGSAAGRLWGPPSRRARSLLP